MIRRLVLTAALLCVCGAAVLASRSGVTLPSGWRLQPPQGAIAATGDMPQGIALSPDGKMLAIAESGVNPAALRILALPALTEQAVIALPDAFGSPIWRGNDHVLVAGGSSGAILDVDLAHHSFTRAFSNTSGSWPAAIAVSARGTIASANDGNATVTIGDTNVPVGEHPAALLFSRDGSALYVTLRGSDAVAVIDVVSKRVERIPAGRHPGALALSDDGKTLYVAESDNDSVGIIDTIRRARRSSIDVGLHTGRVRGQGASPNALLLHGTDLFVSLGAENAVALIRNGAVAERIPAGWYPTGLALGPDGTLYTANGRGEGAPPNPQFDPFKRNSPGYVGSINIGSVRAIPPSAYARAQFETDSVLADAQPQWTAPPDSQTIVRANGPIRHVIYVIKENRTYDQVLGDLAGADGDPKLTVFGGKITPNQHALSHRFGTFDNAYADAEVSAPGHNWTDAAFANDYVERFWPPNYGGRRDAYDFQDGHAPDVPHNGYLWDAAKRAGVTYRDYGEDIDFPAKGPKIGINTFAGLAGHFDPAYVGWDLGTSDGARFEEWQREFARFVAGKNLPQLEIVYLPNDHTSGTRPGALTPQAYVATNDLAVGHLVEAVSHSPYWRSTAIVILEDDAQNGADHVSDQRSTFYIASAYARGGVQHAHYSTSSFVRTIELFLGLPPLSIYDATARPLYDAFMETPANAGAYTALTPSIDMNAINTRTAYRAADSARLDFSHADAANEEVLNDVVMHAGKH